MTKDKLTLNQSSKPAKKDRFEPTETDLSLSDTAQSNSVDGSVNNDRFKESSGYDLNRRYTEEDFADSLTSVNSEQLPKIPAPDGFTQRWVGNPDGADVRTQATYRQMLELGWRPRQADTIEARYKTGFESAAKSTNMDSGTYCYGEMILMIIPTVKFKMNRAEVSRKTRARASQISEFAQGAGVKNRRYSETNVDVADIKVTTGNGRVPPVGN